MHLRTEVRADRICIRFFPIHLRYRCWSWEEIASIDVREYSPLREYGGWGIRLGAKGWAYNVSGRIGVQLILKSGKRILIGTQEPDAFLAAVQAAVTPEGRRRCRAGGTRTARRPGRAVGAAPGDAAGPPPPKQPAGFERSYCSRTARIGEPHSCKEPPMNALRLPSRPGVGPLAPRRLLPLACAALLGAAACASSSPPPPADPGAATFVREAGPPDPDPRVGLGAGFLDAEEASWNLRLVSSTPPPRDFVGSWNSDLAFKGNYVIQGNFHGILIWDVGDPSRP